MYVIHSLDTITSTIFVFVINYSSLRIGTPCTIIITSNFYSDNICLSRLSLKRLLIDRYIMYNQIAINVTIVIF